MIMFYVAANMVWLKVVNNNIDEYLDKDNVSRVNILMRQSRLSSLD